MNIYNARMISFLLFTFSMRLDVINSLLIVCFYNGLKSYQVGQYLQNSWCVMAINQYLWNIALNLQSIQ